MDLNNVKANKQPHKLEKKSFNLKDSNTVNF